MSNPYFTVNENGVFTVDTSDVKAAFETAYKNALGQTLDVNAGAQKQLIINDTETVVAFMNDVCLLLNSENIFYAKGEALNVTAARFGYYRKQNTHTVVAATITGDEGTVIPAGSLASDGTNEYELLETVSIPVGGTVDVEFQAVEPGTVVCLAGTLTTIVSVIAGWDTVDNAQAGISGYDEESDNTFRNRVLNTLLQMRAKVLLGAIAANVGQVDNVLSVKVLENPVNATNTVEGVSMPPYSIYVGVLGGNGSDIAEALARTKTLGCPMVGDTVVTYYDAQAAYNNNYKIQRPNITPIDVEITYSATATTPANIQTVLADTLLAYLSDNMPQIGQTVSSFYLNKAFDGFGYAQIYSVKVKLHSDVSFGDYAVINADEIAQLVAGNISFTVV